MTASGNITGAYILGNGSQLTGINTSSSSISNGNSNVNIPSANGNVNISAVGNANILIVTGTGVNVAGTFNTTGNLTAGNIIAGNGTGGNITNANVISANTFTASNVNLTAYKETVVAGGNTGAATLTPNVATGTIFNYTLTGNITINALGNALAGSSAVLILTQDATGNRLLSSTMKFAGNSKTLSTAASSIDIMSVFYDGTTYYATLSKGYA
jgi:hypothetical protein